jgi:Protein of unknown function (DUF3489)
MSRQLSKKPSHSSEDELPKHQNSKVLRNSKTGILIGLLKRKHGVSISEMMEATGWQAHSIRGFMAGSLKKKLGQSPTSTKTKTGERRYHIAG